MRVSKWLLLRLRHNVPVYMFWDVPKERIRNSNGRLVVAEKLIALVLPTTILLGVAFANKWYPYTQQPPALEALNFMNPELVRTMRKTGQGGARKIKVMNQYGQMSVFPRGKNYLAMGNYDLIALHNDCLNKLIEIHWASEPYLFMGQQVDVWLLKDCNGDVLVNYKRKFMRRIESLETNRKAVFISLFLSFSAFVFSFRNYRQALNRLKILSNG